MSRVGVAITCLDCGGDLATVNQAPPLGHRAHIVLGCLDCGAEWHLRADLARVGGAGARPPGSRRVYRSGDALDALAAEAHRLVRSGHSVTHACRTVGIDRRTYHDRHDPTRARKATAA